MTTQPLSDTVQKSYQAKGFFIFRDSSQPYDMLNRMVRYFLADESDPIPHRASRAANLIRGYVLAEGGED